MRRRLKPGRSSLANSPARSTINRGPVSGPRCRLLRRADQSHQAMPTAVKAAAAQLIPPTTYPSAAVSPSATSTTAVRDADFAIEVFKARTLASSRWPVRICALQRMLEPELGSRDPATHLAERL